MDARHTEETRSWSATSSIRTSCSCFLSFGMVSPLPSVGSLSTTNGCTKCTTSCSLPSPSCGTRYLMNSIKRKSFSQTLSISRSDSRVRTDYSFSNRLELRQVQVLALDFLRHLPDAHAPDYRVPFSRRRLRDIRPPRRAFIALGNWNAHLRDGGHHCEHKGVELD